MSLIQVIKIAELVKSGEASLQTGPFGTQLKASDYVEHGVPVINVRNIGFGDIRQDNLEFLNEVMTEKMSAHKLKQGDIVFGRKGAVERHAFIKDIGIGWIQGSDCLRLRINSDKIDNQFVSYFFKTNAHQDWMQAVCSFGATMASLNQDIVKLITIPLPPLDVQRKIAGILSAYDDLIENNKRRIALLEKMAEELYREWFVRFRFPGWREAEFEKGIPKGWELVKLPEVAEITYGFPFQANRFNDKGIGRSIIRIRNIPSSSTNDYTDEVASNKYIVNSGDFVIGMDGEFHMNYWYGGTAYLVQRVCKVKAKNSAIQGYLSRSLKPLVKHYESILMGATVGHLGAKHLNEMDIMIPSAELQKKLHVFNDFERQKLELSLINQNLEKTKNALLPRLMSGRLAVEDLAVQLPPSMREEGAVSC